METWPLKTSEEEEEVHDDDDDDDEEEDDDDDDDGIHIIGRASLQYSPEGQFL